jgi:DNA-binding transcriptional regulator LsrR (DeoR family)
MVVVTPRRKRPIDAGQFDLRMKAMELYAVEHQTLKAISEQLDVSERTLRRWLADVPRVRLGR